MSQVNIYTVLDKKAGIYNTPQFLVNDEVAIRLFEFLVNQPESVMARYPEDYSLYRIGSYDLDTGIIIPEAYPKPLSNALSIQLDKATPESIKELRTAMKIRKGE